MVVYAERAVMGIHHGQFTPGPVNNCYAQKKKKKPVRQRRDLNPQQLILTVLLISDKPQDKTREASKLVSAQTDIPMQELNNAWLYVSYTLKYLCCSLQSFSGSSSVNCFAVVC